MTLQEIKQKHQLQDAYLGDGVYVSFDGYQIWLRLDPGVSEGIALEAPVFANLEAFAKRVRDAYKEHDQVWE